MIELDVDPETGMKNYIANRQYSHFTPTSYEYTYGQLEAAVACARERDPEAYIYLGAAIHTLEGRLKPNEVLCTLIVKANS
jgi:hypothetical protein